MKHPLKHSASLLLLAAFSGVLAAPAAGQSFELLQGTPANPGSSIRGLSADGNAAAGSIGTVTSIQPFYWTRASGLQSLVDLGVPDERYSGEDLSGNGLVVIGTNGVNGFRWSQAGGFQRLLAPSGYLGAIPASTNNDGSLVGGVVRVDRPRGAPPAYYATRWDAAGTPTLLDPNRTLGDSFVNAVSRDGSTIIGYGNGGGGQQAYKWTATGGIQVLPNLLGGPGGGNRAEAVNGDAQFIVGNSNDIPVVWHDNIVSALTLPDGGRAYATPLAVSDDGSVIGGSLLTPSFEGVAGVWTPATQFIPLTDYLASFGVYVPEGITLTSVTAISADGRTFVGKTFGDNDFIATVPSPGVAMVGFFGSILASRRRRS